MDVQVQLVGWWEELRTVFTSDSLEPHADLEGEAPDGSFANRNGRHAIGHVDDYGALQQQVLEGRALVQRMEAALQACLNAALLEISSGKVMLRRLLTNQSVFANGRCFMFLSYRLWTTTQWRRCSPTQRPCIRFWTRPSLCSRCSGGRLCRAAMDPSISFRGLEPQHHLVNIYWSLKNEMLHKCAWCWFPLRSSPCVRRSSCCVCGSPSRRRFYREPSSVCAAPAEPKKAWRPSSSTSVSLNSLFGASVFPQMLKLKKQKLGLHDYRKSWSWFFWSVLNHDYLTWLGVGNMTEILLSWNKMTPIMMLLYFARNNDTDSHYQFW